jgi:hypothetical protein
LSPAAALWQLRQERSYVGLHLNRMHVELYHVKSLFAPDPNELIVTVCMHVSTYAPG